jgi:hypothetical protein
MISYKDRDKLGTEKIPIGRKNYVGVEIEFILNIDKMDKLEELLIERNLQYNVDITDDDSIEPDDKDDIEESIWGDKYFLDEEGIELRILAEESEVKLIVSQCLAIIRSVGGRVNNSCGLHVHIDLRSRDIKKVYNNFFMCQDLMFATQPKSRQNSDFCKKLSRLNSEGRSRYYAINKAAYEKHKTIEIRLHEATLTTKNVLRWIELLIYIASIEKTLTKKITLPSQLAISNSLKGHLNDRIEKYSNESNSKGA